MCGVNAVGIFVALLPDVMASSSPLARYVSERFVHLEVGEAALTSLQAHPQSHCVDRIQKMGLLTRSKQVWRMGVWRMEVWRMEV